VFPEILCYKPEFFKTFIYKKLQVRIRFKKTIMIHDLIKKARTFRRYKEEKKISREVLTELVDCARLSASPRNQQSLKFKITDAPEERAKLFKYTAWAGALKDWPGPAEGERPAAYILIFDDLNIEPEAKKRWEGTACGIAAQSVVLAAAEKGIGSCMIAALNRQGITRDFDIPEHLNLLLAIALGEPNEIVELEEMKAGDSFNYYRDKNNIHHVPKRPLDELLID